MASHPSGSREDVELVHIETDECSLIIKGKPYHERFEGLKQYRVMDRHDVMYFFAHGTSVQEVQVFDVNVGELVTSDYLRPIFFENGIYQLIVVPKDEREFTFYHEHPALRRAVSPTKIGKQKILMGNLYFQNEVGYTTFEIHAEKKCILSVTMEIFPVKLDYKKDYEKLLEEVNDEIYNLAYHFIRKTYLGARVNLSGKPSRSEFYRLIIQHFQQFIRSIKRIEKQPHHQLQTLHEKVRGDQLRRVDSKGRSYLRKRPDLFVEVQNGLLLNQKQMLPTQGLRMKKEQTYDTLENRYVKWMMERLIHKLGDLKSSVKKANTKWNKDSDQELLNIIETMMIQLKTAIKQSFWLQIGKLDRSVMSLVLQMAPGYRDVFRIYLTVTKGLALRGSFYKMSVKDVATLYEYWTFLKLGQILGSKYETLYQDIIKVNRLGLFVNLESNKKSERIFQHPVTKERIILTYQKFEGNLPTIPQKPDTMLSISKKGKDYNYHYIFDAKYRIDYAQEGSYYQSRYETPGPMEDDINTMHRYRDSIVAANHGPYERTAFGAYVLFPWFDELSYQEHNLYKSINKVNIGGLPFLPNATTLVEQFIERLIEAGPEDLQKEGILPKGTLEEWKSSVEELVLVGLVTTDDEYRSCILTGKYSMSTDRLRKGWQEAKYVALYLKNGVAEINGIPVYGEVKEIHWVQNAVQFEVKHWITLRETIKPVGYGIANYMMTTLNTLKEAKELPELYMKSKDEMMLWRMLLRVSDRIKVDLDALILDDVTSVKEYKIKEMTIFLDATRKQIQFQGSSRKETISLSQFINQPNSVFKLLVQILLESNDL